MFSNVPRAFDGATLNPKSGRQDRSKDDQAVAELRRFFLRFLTGERGGPVVLDAGTGEAEDPYDWDPSLKPRSLFPSWAAMASCSNSTAQAASESCPG
jgi:hypothetical protein